MHKVFAGIFFCFFFFSGFCAFAQVTQIDAHPKSIFNDARELFENKKYGAAKDKFEEYIEVAKSDLLKAEAYYYRAMSAMELFSNETEALFLTFLDKYPENPKAELVNFQLGKFSFRQRDYEKALKYFKQTSPTSFPSSERSEYYFMLGYSYYDQEDYKNARDAFEKITEKENPYFAQANYYYGYTAYLESDFETAIKYFKRIEDDKQFNDVVPVYIVQLYLQQGQIEDAISYGEKALENDRIGKKEKIKGFLAEAYYSKKNYEKVIQYLEEISGLTSEQTYELAFSYYQNKQYEDAIEQFNYLNIKEDSLGQFVSYHLGDAYLKIGEKERARNAFFFASEIDIGSKIRKLALFNYAKLSYDLRYQKVAITSLQDFMKKYPKDPLASEAKSLLSDILLATKNYKEALNVIESIPNKTTKIRTAQQQISYLYGLELFKNNNFSKSKELFIQSLSNPLDQKFRALAYFWLAESYFNLKDYKSALQEYRNFLFLNSSDQTPYRPDGYYGAGYSNFKMEAYTDATYDFKRFVERSEDKNDPRYWDGVARLADCYFSQKNYSSALTYYNQVIDKQANEADYALYQKGIIDGLQGDGQNKIRTLERLINKYPRSSYADDAQFEIGDTYFQMGNLKKAQEEFRTITRQYPQSPYFRVAMLKIGLIFYNIKNDEQAIKIYKSIVSKYPHSVEAKEAVTGLRNIYIDRGQADSLFAFLKNVPQATLTASFQDSASYSSAFSFLKDNNCNKAIDAFEQYLRRFPNGFFELNAHYYLAECAIEENLPKKAILHYREVVDKSPNQFSEKALAMLSDLNYQEKDYTQALKYYKRLEETAGKAGNELKAKQGLMRCYFLTEDFENAAAKASEVLEQPDATNTDKIEADFYYGKSQKKLGNDEDALPKLLTVAKENTSEIGAEAKYLAAEIYFAQGEYDTTQDQIFELRDQFSNYDYWVAKSFILLADVFAAKGDYFQARHTLLSILENYEGNDLKQEAKEKLQKIKQQEESVKDTLENR